MTVAAWVPAVPDRGEPCPEEAVSGAQLRSLTDAGTRRGDDLRLGSPLDGRTAPKAGAEGGKKGRQHRSERQTIDGQQTPIYQADRNLREGHYCATAVCCVVDPSHGLWYYLFNNVMEMRRGICNHN